MLNQQRHLAFHRIRETDTVDLESRWIGTVILAVKLAISTKTPITFLTRPKEKTSSQPHQHETPENHPSHPSPP